MEQTSNWPLLLYRTYQYDVGCLEIRNQKMTYSDLECLAKKGISMYLRVAYCDITHMDWHQVSIEQIVALFPGCLRFDL